MIGAQLFPRTNAQATNMSAQGKAGGLISLDEVHCTGTEKHIVDCGVTKDDWAIHDCTHGEDAGVVCANSEYWYITGEQLIYN